MLSVRALSTDYPGGRGAPVNAVQELAFDVPQGKFFTLLGPSGCGKTTTLRSIAGLERPRKGEITVDSTVVFSAAHGVFVPANRRGFGMVFQSYAIWPHMNVYQNVAFPLVAGRRRIPKDEIRARVLRVLDTVALDDVATRDATTLSGGQQQRLALARALVLEPKLLLLDEPLSNLDAKLRERMRFELEQLGSPRTVYGRPANPFVADFVGTTNFIRGTVASMQSGSSTLVVASEIGAVTALATEPMRVGADVVLTVRPEDVELSETAATGINAWRATVDQKVFLGEAIDFRVRIGERVLLSRTHPRLTTRIGQPIHIVIAQEK